MLSGGKHAAGLPQTAEIRYLFGLIPKLEKIIAYFYHSDKKFFRSILYKMHIKFL